MESKETGVPNQSEVMESEKTDSSNLLEEQTEKIQQEAVQLSKNQLKKLKRKEMWLANKQEKRRNAKMRKKERLAEMRQNGEDTGPTRKSLKLKTMKNSCCKIKVVIDLSLDKYMGEKDINSLTCQLQHSYAANRRAENPMQLYFCGISGQTKERLDRIGDYRGWDIYPETQSYERLFPKEDIVYLSSESSNVLTTLSEDKVYVIGGLVDHNQHKGLCHRLAEEKGISHAQLPISEFLDMKTRKVLTVNQVFSILLRYTECKDWKNAFLTEMPQRKQANAKEESSHQSCISTAEEENSSSSSQTFKDQAMSATKDDAVLFKEHSDLVEALHKSECEESASVENDVSRLDSLESISEANINNKSQSEMSTGNGIHKEDNDVTNSDVVIDSADNDENK